MNDFLAKLLGYVMKGCYWLTNNYVLALLLFALAMQILMLPLGLKQQKNMIKQAKLRPREMAIRKKYAGRNDQVSMKKCQNEIMEMYQQEGYSTMAGCLPMIIQLIIVFPLYQVVIRPLEFISGLTSDMCKTMATALIGDGGTSSNTYQIDLIRKIEELGIGNLSEKFQGFLDGKTLPDVSLFGVDLGITPFNALKGISWWLVFVPILNLGLMYLSQFLSKKFTYQNTQAEAANSSSMKIMMYVLPLMTFFITFNFASAIGIYWIFRTILSMAQQFILAKAMPYPVFTEEDYKKAEREYKKGKSGQDTVYPQREYRSLHHIDDDDYPAPKNNKNKNGKGQNGKGQNGKGQNGKAPDEKPVEPVTKENVAPVSDEKSITDESVTDDSVTKDDPKEE